MSEILPQKLKVVPFHKAMGAFAMAVSVMSFVINVGLAFALNMSVDARILFERIFNPFTPDACDNFAYALVNATYIVHIPVAVLLAATLIYMAFKSLVVRNRSLILLMLFGLLIASPNFMLVFMDEPFGRNAIGRFCNGTSGSVSVFRHMIMLPLAAWLVLGFGRILWLVPRR